MLQNHELFVTRDDYMGKIIYFSGVCAMEMNVCCPDN